MRSTTAAAASLLALLPSADFLVQSFSVTRLQQRQRTVTTTRLLEQIVSPFDKKEGEDEAVATLPEDFGDKGPLDLTWENVEMVLDEMRPYLIQDGGNVAITEIDGPVVLLELQGACGTCPSSTVRRG